MDLAKVHGCLALSILTLLLLVDPTAACYCKQPMVLSTAFCVLDVVIGGSFLDARFEGPDKTWLIYDFKVNDVFKGPVNAGEKINLYTQFLGTTCGYRHLKAFGEDEYIVTGRLDGDHIVISVCSFIMSWNELTPDRNAGREQLYNTYCDWTAND